MTRADDFFVRPSATVQAKNALLCGSLHSWHDSSRSWLFVNGREGGLQAIRCADAVSIRLANDRAVRAEVSFNWRLTIDGHLPAMPITRSADTRLPTSMLSERSQINGKG